MYAVYLKITFTFISGDHVILDYHDFFHIRNPQCLSIRTLAKDSESLDSLSIPLSSQLLEEVTRGQVTAIVPKVSKVVLGQIGVDATKTQVQIIRIIYILQSVMCMNMSDYLHKPNVYVVTKLNV